MSDKIEKMTDDDFKKIMRQLGMPDSRSLYAALKQVENHTWQAAQAVPVVGEPVGLATRIEALKKIASDLGAATSAVLLGFKSPAAVSLVATRLINELCEFNDDLLAMPATSITAAELERLRKDAERYRWLRGGMESSPTDDVIDAAIAAEGEKK